MLLGLGIFVFLSLYYWRVETGDVWCHLRTGQWILNSHQVPNTDVFPFAHEKTAWNNFEWLGSVLLFLVYKAGGLLGLKVLRPLVFLGAICLFLVFSDRRVPFSVLVLLALILSLALFQRTVLRPDQFNNLFIPLFLILLFSYEDHGGFWKLALLPVAGIVWYNIHPAALFYGAPLIGIFCLSAWLQALGAAPAGSRQRAKELSWVLGLYLAAFIVNPYGWEGLVFPYKIFLFPKYFDFYKKMSVTSEFQPPAYIFLSLRYSYYFFLMAVPLVLFALNRKGNFVLMVLYAVSLFFFLKMVRNCNFFAIVSAFVIVRAAQEARFRELWSTWRWSAAADKVILAAVGLFIVVRIMTVCTETAYIGGSKTKVMSLQANPYVVSSIEVLLDHHIYGRVFNSTLLGGSLVWFGYPQLRPFNDGRDADPQRFNNYMSVVTDPEAAWSRAERDYGFTIAMLNLQNISDRKFFRFFFAQPDWQLISLKGYIAVSVKRGAFHLPEALDRYEEQLKAEALDPQDMALLKQLSQGHARLGTFLEPSPVEVDWFDTGESLMALGFQGAAGRNFIKALQVSDQPYMLETVHRFLNAAQGEGSSP